LIDQESVWQKDSLEQGQVCAFPASVGRHPRFPEYSRTTRNSKGEIE
jgi:hypothetical protein